MIPLSTREARRLALAKAGLLKPRLTGLPATARGRGASARAAALRVIDRFGYLQLDTVSIAGARSHALVLLSRLPGIGPDLGEELLQPGQPLFEYWGHEACWLPMDLYPAFEFRRREFRQHPWWGDVVRAHPGVAKDLRRRIRAEGAIRSLDMEGRGSRGWWDIKIAKRVATALWSSGELAIRERRNFQRSFDLAERVIPETARAEPLARDRALEVLLLKALDGHGWATTGTLEQTWRLRNRREQVVAALARLQARGLVAPCALADGRSRDVAGWIRPEDRELAARLDGLRPREDHGVLLSPFDPVLWDRPRVKRLFGFDQVLEIFKPASQRVHGYFVLPVLAGDRLVARVDLKAERASGTLRVLSSTFEDAGPARSAHAEAARAALERHAAALGLAVTKAPRRDPEREVRARRSGAR